MKVVFLFGWFHLLFMPETCTNIFPMLLVWEHGVAVTSLLSFVSNFIQVSIGLVSVGLNPSPTAKIPA